MPPRKGNGCSPQFPRDSVAAALAPPPLLKLTPHPLQGGHTLLPFHSIHRLPSKLLAQTMLSQGSSSFHACLPERHRRSPDAMRPPSTVRSNRKPWTIPSLKRTATGAAARGSGHSKSITKTSRPSVAAVVNDLPDDGAGGVCLDGASSCAVSGRFRSLFQTTGRLKVSAPSPASGSPFRKPKIHLFFRVKPARNKRTTAPITAVMGEPTRSPPVAAPKAPKINPPTRAPTTPTKMFPRTPNP